MAKLAHLLRRPAIGIRTLNEAEIAVAERLIAEGYEIVKRGWPDFIAIRGDEIRFIEVKPRATTPLKASQSRVATLLFRFGIIVEKLSP